VVFSTIVRHGVPWIKSFPSPHRLKPEPCLITLLVPADAGASALANAGMCSISAKPGAKTDGHTCTDFQMSEVHVVS